MRALDRLLASVSMKPSRKVVILPDGSEFEFWMTPLTLAERSKAQKNAKTDDSTEFALQLLVSKAKDKNGVPRFHQGDLVDLNNRLPASVVESLLLLLIGEAEANEEDEELDMKSDQEATERKQPANGGARRSRKAA